MDFKIPDKPDYLSDAEWTAILKRNNPAVCENFGAGTCPELRGSINAEGVIDLSVDHHQARSKGGEDSARNCRLICHNGCENSNLRRGAGLDPYWEKEFWFDNYDTFKELRNTQYICGPQRIEECSDLFVDPDKRQELLKYLSLFALTTGAGKTLLMVSVLLAVNKEVLGRGQGPRVGRALWFVPERALADQLAVELAGAGKDTESEITKYRLHYRAPRVFVCESWSDLSKGHHYNDITIACPQSLWKRGDELRSDADVAEVLSRYDTLIWDECDFAGDQIERLVSLARHALKFGLTATPIDAAGAIPVKRFLLAHVASYKLVRRLDRCLKNVPTWEDGLEKGYIVPVQCGKREVGSRGRSEIRSGPSGDKYSLPGQSATIKRAISDMAHLEAEMRNVLPLGWFSPHLLVRCPSIDILDHLFESVSRYLFEEKYHLKGEGWRPTLIYTGAKKKVVWENGVRHKKPLPPDELYLYHAPEDEKKAQKIHPFLIAKQNGNAGRCTPKSSRILFVVDMAIRGLNNWPCLTIVDIALSDSLPSQLQLEGRADRLPLHLQQYLGTDYERYITTRYYFPDFQGNRISSMQEARGWKHDMDAKIAGAGLLTWDQLLEGETYAQTENAEIDLVEPFSDVDRIQIDTELGSMIEGGKTLEDLASLGDDDIEKIISKLPPELTEKRKKSAIDHLKKITTDDEYRNGFAQMPKIKHEEAILWEGPKDPLEYGPNELLDYLSRSSDIPPEVQASIGKQVNDPNIKFLLGLGLHKKEARDYYAAPVAVRHLAGSGGIANQLINQIVDSFLRHKMFYDRDTAWRTISPAFYTALHTVFGVESASNEDVLDQPGYHHKILSPGIQRKLRRVTFYYLVKQGSLGAASTLYGYQRWTI